MLKKVNCSREVKTNDEKLPYLSILIQPQERFRFRYSTEVQSEKKRAKDRASVLEQASSGTQHGSLRGRCSAPENKAKFNGYPTIELVNYSGKAKVKCSLVQFDNEEEHPYNLAKTNKMHQFSHVVPERGSYTVEFRGMGIIVVTGDDVNKLVKNQLSKKCGHPINDQQIKTAKENINLNKVRLKFSAHDVDTDEEICGAVFSEPISNSRCPATNDLRIVRMSHSRGSSAGGTNILMFVSKVSKKDIEIWFKQKSDTGDEIWSEKATFLPQQVHYQYGIEFRTPSYSNPRVGKDVEVFVELRRPSDDSRSEPMLYTYTADRIHKETKKRKYAEVPDVFTNCYEYNKPMIDTENGPMLPVPATPMASTSNNFLLLDHDGANLQPYEVADLPDDLTNCNEYNGPMIDMDKDPLLAATPVALTSNSIACLSLDDDVDSWHNLHELAYEVTDLPDMAGIYDFHADSGRGKGSQSEPSCSHFQMDSKANIVNIKKEKSEYTAVYTSEDGAEVKRLVKELCDMIRNKKDNTKQNLRNIMERLFEIRLSNGDTFLHMALQKNSSSFEYIVKLLYSLKMTFILDLTNDKEQTILHYAVAKNMPDTVSLLVSKGCNPMMKDHEENNAVHYAVRYQSCLEPLLDAIKKNDVVCDLNAFNIEKQSPLHLAAIYDCAVSAGALLGHGASYNVRDADGRTPLHLAAYDNKLRCARVLLDYIEPEDIDAVDGNYGYTALQIVCAVTMRQNTCEMVDLLLKKKADPWKQEDNNEPAWRLVRNKPEIYEILKKYASSCASTDDRSAGGASDEEFITADEMDE